MSNFVLSLLIGASLGSWLYFKFQKHSGYGNNGPAAIGGLASGIIIFIVVWLTLNLIFH